METVKWFYWKTEFERVNFGFIPYLKQTADVLFKVKHSEYNDDTMIDFQEEAWKAMWKQNPQWKNPKGPIGKKSWGWSSVLGGYAGSKYIRIEIKPE